MKRNRDHASAQDRDVRFTAVHRHCIRIEAATHGGFIDAPTLFAANRGAWASDVKTDLLPGGGVRLDTGAIRLEYRPDGKPLGASNLQAVISHKSKRVIWKPGMRPQANLGGTATTLDGWTGARHLPDGLLARDGWSLIDDSGKPLIIDNWAQPRPAGGTDWYLFGYGPDFHAAFQAFAAISGSIPLPRRRTLGAWYSRYWPYSSADYRAIIAEYARHDFPLDVMVMDMDWHINDAKRAPGAVANGNGQVWTGYTWDRELLPDAEALLADLHQDGLLVTLNDHPACGVQPHEEMYTAFMKAMGGKPDGTTIPFDAGDKRYFDTFYALTHANLEKSGVDFWWLDWQQYRDTLSLPGLTNLEWLNTCFHERARRDGLRGQSFSRWGGWGDHRHPIHFSGDADTGWPMLAFEVPFTATAGNVGCFFWSHDIGGHQGSRNEESYVRWCQFGAFSAALRSHSTRKADMDRRPWTYSPQACDAMHRSFHMRSEWFPYIYTAVANSCRDTFPFIRPMYLAVPEADEAYRNPQQYMLGDHLLVAPVAEPGIGPRKLARQTVWFPEGVWYHVFSGERFEGPCERLIPSELDEFPLFARGGAALPVQPYTPRMGAGMGENLIIRCWPGIPGRTVETSLYEDDGDSEAWMQGASARMSISCTQTEHGIRLDLGAVEGSFTGQLETRTITVCLPCTRKPQCATVDGKPAVVTYDRKTSESRITLPACSIRECHAIDVEVTPANAEIARLKAFARRAGIRQPAAGTAFADALRNALQQAKPAQQHRLLRAAGAGLFRKNETWYGFPDTPDAFLYLPEAVPVARDATLEAEAQCFPLAIHASKTKLPLDKLLAQRQPPPDEIMTATETLHCRTTITLGKTTVTLEDAINVTLPYWQFEQNLAPSATATASSCMEDQPPASAIDGVADGIPGDRFREWASNAEKTGAWLRLDWKKTVTAGRVLLFDRPNKWDHILEGRLILSDGTVLPVGELPDDGKTPLEVRFTPRRLKWLILVITRVSEKTGWTGLSEIGVY